MFNPSQFSFQQQQCPPLIPTEPFIQPPGTHLFANYASQPVWTPIGYDSVTQPGNETAYPTANPNSFWVTQPAATGYVHPPQEANVVQSVRCDVCNVDCNNRDVFEKHLLGKKHKGNLEARNNPMVMMLAASNAGNNISLPNQMGIGASAVMSASPMLETKTIKVLNSGTAVGSVLGCMTCNVVCNSQDVYNKHMLGKKHAIQGSLASLGEAGPYFAAIRAHFEGTYNKTAPKKVKFVQTAWCEVCKIMCNSSDAYAAHLAGKKHNFNLEQLRNPSNNPMIGPAENAEANKSKSISTVAKKASEEDMLVKRQKIVQAGTAAAMIRTCTICNVVCNSLAVFNSHLGGQKHKDMLQKFQASGSGGA